MKILVIEDDPALRGILKQSLERERYVVETAAGYREALDKSETYQYDCLLLDIMLPDGNGLDLLARLKEGGLQEKIIIISARDSLDDKVLGLNVGADDYLAKPFHLAELNARIRSVTRRGREGGRNVIECGNIKVYPDDYRVEVDDAEVELNRKEFDILHYFALRPNRLLGKSLLAEAVWGDHIDQVDNFDFIYAQIKNLRGKLRRAGALPEIKAVYGMGYKFIAP
ncbi:MAG: response regulator transcription factor [Odoribacteraceae bacterium]|jgi:DNA-binding response OmpR family regulator|nr:response regulator transcription factor [Odoribacteraceae bacterium]